ncbi:MAG: hypothetical protein DRJ42_29315, partial [Deltaproteobacteria bacterium]
MVLRACTRLLVVTLTALVACGDDPAVLDGGTVDGGGDGGVYVAPPEIPWLEDGVPEIMLAPCPDAWREVVVDGVTECDPYPVEPQPTCDAGDVHFPGEARCRPIGEACPGGDYAATLPTDGSVVYVNAAAAGGGDGTLAGPYAGLSDIAWSSLSPGTTVALAKGTYEGTVHVRGGVRVVGACVRDTRLTGYTGPIPSVVTALPGVGEGVVENLTIGGAVQRGVLVDGGRSLVLEGVLIEGTQETGVLVSDPGTMVTLRDVVIRDTQEQTGVERFGHGIVVVSGAELTATRLVVSRSHEIGILLYGGGTAVTLTDAVIRETAPRESDGTLGRGIDAEDGAALTATRVLIADNHDIGIFVFGDGTAAALTDVIVRDTQPQRSDGLYGRGVDVEEGGELTATRLVIANNHTTGLYAAQGGTRVTLTDVVIRDTQPNVGDAAGGRGLNVEGEVSLTATRLSIARSHELGAYVAGRLASVILTDTAIRETKQRASDSAGGRGLNVEYGARVEGDRVVIEDSLEFGVLSTDGASVTLRDTAIVGVSRAACVTSTCPEEPYGHGVAVVSGGLEFKRFQIHDAATCGIFLAQLGGVAPGVVLYLEAGVVSSSEIGVCVQVEGYDFARLTNGVEYRD